MNIHDSVTTLRGVGEKTAMQLQGMGIATLLDLILYFPRSYEQRMEAREDLLDGTVLVVLPGVAEKIGRPLRTGRGKTLVTGWFQSDFGRIKATWFNMPYVQSSFTMGETYELLGKFSKKGKNLEVVNPSVNRDREGIVPQYPLKEKVTNTLLRKLLRQVFDKVRINENLPRNVLEAEDLMPLDDAVRSLHFPKEEAVLQAALKRLRFQEMFSYSLKIFLSKSLRTESGKGVRFAMSPRLRQLKERIPYALTGAQSRVVREILKDQKNNWPMNRLLQGDVGSGKTIVALIALFNVVDNGYQGVFMAPTEILAQQHYKEALDLLKGLDVPVELLTGSSTVTQRQQILGALEKGTPMLLVGTHALIEERVQLPKLGMIVTDEQHRFGVQQRAKLMGKAEAADVLVMSATPIPRTMALTIYSDLDLSVLDELPPGRIPIETVLYEEAKRVLAYRRLVEELDAGRQGYIVTPLIEENEEHSMASVEGLYEKLTKTYLKGYSLAMLHGKMASREKDKVMQAFKEGKIQVLLSTTVIEVGVHVRNASVMLIENAERFGLAQLHQLRGRVGRGEHPSHCLLLAEIRSEETRRRLRIMEESTDGFHIAEEDLKLRGTGELFGVNQSGSSGLVLSDLTRDYALFLKANAYARKVFFGTEPEAKRIREEFLEQVTARLNLICLN